MRERRLNFAIVILVASLTFAEEAPGYLDATVHERGPPRPSASSPLLLPPLLSDQSEYVSLGDDVGSALAVGDFTRDQYVDLVMTNNKKMMRSIFISEWHQADYSFHPVERTWNSTAHAASFSLDSIRSLEPTAHIAAAAPLDANADGNLDLIVSVRINEATYAGIVLLGNGMGGFQPGQLLHDVGPDLLIMDGDGDLIADIMFTTADGDFAFYRNSPPGEFSLVRWNPFTFNSDGPVNASAQPVGKLEDCRPPKGFNSHAFVDLNGDCLPDLVVSTHNCGMLVWINEGTALAKDGRPLPKGGNSESKPFWDLSVRSDMGRLVQLGEEVWSEKRGDGRATFADFNADGTIDVAVPNKELATVKLSLNSQEKRRFGKLCTADAHWRLETYPAIHDIRLADTMVGRSHVPAALHVGDFNYDGLMDILVLSADTGTVDLFEATKIPVESHLFWKEFSAIPADSSGKKTWGGNLFWSQDEDDLQKIVFERVIDRNAALSSIEDPVAAAFFDLDESGRQDILIVQGHGTRMIWNNYNEMDDSEFFKVTSSNAVANGVQRKAFTKRQPFVPMPGNTVKISYGGHNGHEQHICTQCPQTSLMSLQSCSCLFGIRRIANYIEEMSMGGGGVVRSWSALMPNTMAMLWPVGDARGRWQVAYFTTGRGRQMLGVVFVLFATLIVLAVGIGYLHAAERNEEKKQHIYLHHQFGG